MRPAPRRAVFAYGMMVILAICFFYYILRQCEILLADLEKEKKGGANDA